MNKNSKKNIEDLSDFELNEFIKKGKTVKGDEIFNALKEFRIREQIKFDKNHKNTNTEAKKIKIPLSYRINFKALFAISFIIIFISTITYFSIYKKDNFTIDYVKYNQLTTGIVRNIEAKNVYKQGLDGAKEITLYYSVFYDFLINNTSYSGSMLINNKTGNNKYLNSLRNNLGGTVTILYSRDNPNVNIIDLNKLLE